MMEFTFWVQFVEIPVVAALFWLHWTHQRDCAQSRKAVQDQITEIRVEVAKDYVNHASLKEIGDRLDKQLSDLAKQLEANKLGWQTQFETLGSRLDAWMHDCKPVKRG